jgi:hypothetical protein
MQPGQVFGLSVLERGDGKAIDAGAALVLSDLSGDVRKSSLDDTRKGPPDDVAGVKDGRHGDNFSFL